MADEKMPPLEEMGEETAEPKKDWHEGHMQRVEEGLKTIIASDNLDEIKSIAQSLLTEEKSEQKMEETPKEKTLNDYLGGK